MITFSVSNTSCRRKVDNIDTTKNNQDRKIGYLFYTSFIDEYNPKLFETFAKFKAEGVTDLIVDLRYNRGGSLGAANYLASLIAPRSVVQSKAVFSQLSFNNFLNGVYGDSRKYFFGEYETTESNPLNANLNLNTVYIIATDNSYSAAELLTFCLKPYMTVVHVGSETGGKYTASMTIHAFNKFPDANGKPTVNIVYDSTKLTQSAKDSLRNWGMQPIVAVYADKNNRDFSNPGKLVPDVPVVSRENDITVYKPLADPTDYLIAASLSKMSASLVSGAQYTPTPPRTVTALKPANLFVAKEALFRESVLWSPPTHAASAQTNISNAINVVSDFAYDGLAIFYKWSDYMINKLPTPADNNPVSYFKSVLYPLDTQHGWSWITDDIKELLAEFSGEPLAFGWALNFFWADASRTRIVAFVQYVYPNTPAANAGIVRGNMITQINGNDITETQGSGYYMQLYGNSMISVSVENTSGVNRAVTLTPVRINTNPVLKDTVYTIKK